MKPSDIKIPREVAALCPVAQESYFMRLCMLLESDRKDAIYTSEMNEIATKEAFEVDRQENGLLF